MGFEIEMEDDDKLIIDFDDKSVKGYTSKKNFKKQIEKLKDFTCP